MTSKDKGMVGADGSRSLVHCVNVAPPSLERYRPSRRVPTARLSLSSGSTATAIARRVDPNRSAPTPLQMPLPDARKTPTGSLVTWGGEPAARAVSSTPSPPRSRSTRLV